MNSFAPIAVLALLLAALPGPAQAASQPLRDPTRPPPQAGQPAGGSDAAGATATRAPQLQSVLVGRGRDGRQVAVIDGQSVRVGDSVQGARVTRIDAGEVELVRGRERQVLRLHPSTRQEDVRRTPSQNDRN
ncbi:hypothetical protein [Massilia sp. MS-15]|uniref:hypothetical protein n=1 Tax=Massilia sp. MS-15 TaxID=2878200 RepID=UPI001CD283C5|nr:hypothetical protein [Massilia sp. MS-15]